VIHLHCGVGSRLCGLGSRLCGHVLCRIRCLREQNETAPILCDYPRPTKLEVMRVVCLDGALARSCTISVVPDPIPKFCCHAICRPWVLKMFHSLVHSPLPPLSLSVSSPSPFLSPSYPALHSLPLFLSPSLSFSAQTPLSLSPSLASSFFSFSDVVRRWRSGQKGLGYKG
jgi:hypothetical protein